MAKLKQRNALGKGLGALLSDAGNASNAEQNEVKDILNTVIEVSLANIETNPYQPRQDFEEDALRELADSIRIQGIIQPITVRQLDDKSFQLISGERRLQASKIAGLEKIPAYVRFANDQQMLEMALIENIQRENLNPVEIAFSYQRLLTECALKQEELGDRVGKKRSTVTNYLRLLKLPPELQAALRDQRISMGHARALINIDNVELQLSIFEQTLKEDLSVRKVESLVRDIFQGKEKKEKPAKQKISAEMNQVQSDLSDRFGTQVKVNTADNKKGEIKIPFHSVEDLNRLLELLKQ